MTYICRPCSTQHDIPRREDRPEVGICPVCLEAHALYLVKREPATQASPWVLVGERLPKEGESVEMAYRLGRRRRIGWLSRRGYCKGYWSTEECVPCEAPDYWRPIPPLPPQC